MSEGNITLPVDLTNPGQFFACCGLLEFADRLWPGAEGWFTENQFKITCPNDHSLGELLTEVAKCSVANTMTLFQAERLKQLSGMSKKERDSTSGLEDEKKALESLRRELPIVLSGPISFRIDWFCDVFAGGSRFKTWAGQQSVIDIATAMHQGVKTTTTNESIWNGARGIGLPFNFDSDLGGQGSALDIGFSFDPLAGSEATRIEGICKPTLEFLAFVGLQRFRPLELKRQNRFVYAAWNQPLSPMIAAAYACRSISLNEAAIYEFRLLYRTKYLKSFLPAMPFQGDRDE